MRVHHPLGCASLVLATVLAGCGPAATGSPTPIPSTSPPPAPSSSPSPAAAFELVVSPPESPAESRMAIPGSPYCLLVDVRDVSASAVPVTIAATAERASVADIRPAQLAPGTIGEVCVVADPTDVETTGSVVITASRDGATRTETRSLPVFPMPDERQADAQPYFERWVTWLATAHPELGIAPETTWDPVFVSTLLVVSHYAYWSEDWEMTIAWHNMIAPYDWTEVHLRHRAVDLAPSLAFRIDSVSGGTEPVAIAPPEVVVR